MAVLNLSPPSFHNAFVHSWRTINSLQQWVLNINNNYEYFIIFFANMAC